MSFDPERDLVAPPVTTREATVFLDDLRLSVRKPYGGRLVSGVTGLLSVLAKNIEHTGYYGITEFNIGDDALESLRATFGPAASMIDKFNLKNAVALFAEPRLNDALERYQFSPNPPGRPPSP